MRFKSISLTGAAVILVAMAGLAPKRAFGMDAEPSLFIQMTISQLSTTGVPVTSPFIVSDTITLINGGPRVTHTVVPASGSVLISGAGQTAPWTNGMSVSVTAWSPTGVKSLVLSSVVNTTTKTFTSSNAGVQGSTALATVTGTIPITLPQNLSIMPVEIFATAMNYGGALQTTPIVRFDNLNVGLLTQANANNCKQPVLQCIIMPQWPQLNEPPYPNPIPKTVTIEGSNFGSTISVQLGDQNFNVFGNVTTFLTQTATTLSFDSKLLHWVTATSATGPVPGMALNTVTGMLVNSCSANSTHLKNSAVILYGPGAMNGPVSGGLFSPYNPNLIPPQCTNSTSTELRMTDKSKSDLSEPAR